MTDWIVNSLPWVLAFLWSQAKQSPWQMTAAVFLLLLAAAALTGPSIHAWHFILRTGKTATTEPNIHQFAMGCALLVAFFVLWLIYPEDMKTMANLVFTPTSKKLVVVGVILAIISAIFLTLAFRTPAAPATSQATTSDNEDVNALRKKLDDQGKYIEDLEAENLAMGEHHPFEIKKLSEELWEVTQSRDALKEEKEELEKYAKPNLDEVVGLNSQVYKLTAERDKLKLAADPPENRRALQTAQDLYASKASEVVFMDKSSKWKGYTVAIKVIDDLMAQSVGSFEDLQRLVLTTEYALDIIQRFSRIYAAHLNRDITPPSRVLKQFRAFNPRHNELLNDLDYQAEKWREALKHIESEEARRPPGRGEP
ncbi:MAG: hypothetical protein WD738_13985 [Pirellulales bacterium]